MKRERNWRETEKNYFVRKRRAPTRVTPELWSCNDGQIYNVLCVTPSLFKRQRWVSLMKHCTWYISSDQICTWVVLLSGVSVGLFSYQTCQVPQPVVQIPGEFVGQCNFLIVSHALYLARYTSKKSELTKCTNKARTVLNVNWNELIR